MFNIRIMSFIYIVKNPHHHFYFSESILYSIIEPLKKAIVLNKVIHSLDVLINEQILHSPILESD